MNQNLLPEKFIEEIKKDKEIVAVLLFGSYIKGGKYNDIDICFVLDKKYPNIIMSKKRLKYSSILPAKFDVQIFQQLPLYIRERILKEHKILVCGDEDALYEIALLTVKEFEFYKKIYYNYLKAMEND